MRALIVKLLLAIAVASGPAHAKDLLYIFVDAESPIEYRSMVSEFVTELITRDEIGSDIDIYFHVDTLKIHYPDMPVYDASRRRDMATLLATLTELSQSADYFAFWRNEAPEFLEATDPLTSMGIVSKNILEIEQARGEYEVKYFVQFSNFDFVEPVDTSRLILGDGWLTASDSPMREFIYGSQSRVFNETKIFVVLQEPRNTPLTWFHGRQLFLQKMYSSINSDIISIRRANRILYGGGVVLVESFLTTLNSDIQTLGRLLPQDTNLIQTINPITDTAETVQ